jgi:hypothetical protein
MSSETAPITPARFAEALKELPASSLALKVLELRNSIAHLDYSNAELKPFAEGRATAIDSNNNNAASADSEQQPDQDCIDAIRENEAVIERMQERIALIRAEVEDRGLSWDEFKGKVDEDKTDEAAQTNGDASHAAAAAATNGVNGTAQAQDVQQQHPAWSDGTFTTGTIRGLSDEELLRQLQERMPELQDEGEEGGMHL